jgi:hypothetical protein
MANMKELLDAIAAAGCVATTEPYRDGLKVLIAPATHRATPMTSTFASVEGLVHNAEFKFLKEDLADPKTWATVGATMPTKASLK